MENLISLAHSPAAIIFAVSLGSLVYFMVFVIRGKQPKMGHQ